MGNKQTLQEHNIDLSSILSAIGSLPLEEDVKHGLYVWNKYDNPPTATVSFSWVSGGSTHCIKAECTEVDLTEVTGDFFVGLSGTYTINGSTYNYSFTDSNHITLNGSSNTFSYDQVTKQLTINTHLSSDPSYSDAIKEMEQTFINFVVSDNESKYPDGGTQDGYWYEKVVEGITGIDYGSVTVSGGTSITVNHNLGKAPSNVLFVVDEIPSLSSSKTYAVFKNWYLYRSSSFNKNSAIYYTVTDTTITFNADSTSLPFYSGTYTWVAIA